MSKHGKINYFANISKMLRIKNQLKSILHHRGVAMQDKEIIERWKKRIK